MTLLWGGQASQMVRRICTKRHGTVVEEITRTLEQLVVEIEIEVLHVLREIIAVRRCNHLFQLNGAPVLHVHEQFKFAHILLRKLRSVRLRDAVVPLHPHDRTLHRGCCCAPSHHCFVLFLFLFCYAAERMNVTVHGESEGRGGAGV